MPVYDEVNVPPPGGSGSGKGGSGGGGGGGGGHIGFEGFGASYNGPSSMPPMPPDNERYTDLHFPPSHVSYVNFVSRFL